MKTKQRRIVSAFLGGAAVAVLGAGTWFGVLTTSASREAGRLVREVCRELGGARGMAAPIVARFTITGVDGLPDALENRSGTLSLQLPERAMLAMEIDGDPYAIGRDGEAVWIHAPAKDFGVVGRPDVPRFIGKPESVRVVELPALRIPVSGWQLRLLPALLEAARGEDCALEFGPGDYLRGRLGLPEAQIRIKRAAAAPDVGAAGAWLVTVVLDGGKSRLDARLDAIERPPAEGAGAPSWVIPADGDDRVEEVALAHLERFARSAMGSFGRKIPAIGPATGERRVVAREGGGRLEIIDGTKVLFLKGSPEEMGRQHGTLLKAEIGAVVERILYGIGVGSSFDKGRWFFEEIDEATRRTGPFVDPRCVREMDAIAAASGIEADEIRLANFFPELFHCSGFALHGAATRDGRMYHGRILDYMRGVGLEENAVVIVSRPDDGRNAWVNVSYAGFIGSVTAMNEKQVAIGEMGGRGEGDWDGKPMAQLVREVMENADTIDEALAIMERSPRTCEYYYVISDAKSGRAVGIAATPDRFETVWSGETHPQLPDPVPDTVLLSAGDRYTELVRRVKAGYGTFDADSARELMTRPVCMKSNIHSVLFCPDTLDFWVANADSENPASHTRYTHYNLRQLLESDGMVADSR